MIREDLEKADKLRDKSRYREALKILTRVLEKGCESREDLFQCRLLAGHTYRMLGDFEAAAANYEQAITIARELKDPVKGADAKVSLALSVRGMGDWAAALRLLGSAERVYLRRDDEGALAFLNWAKGGTCRIKGDIDEAIKYFKTAYGEFTRLGDEHAAGFCLNGLGGASRVKGLYGRSLDYYTRANGLFKKLRDPFGLAYSYCGIGNALRMKGEWDPAAASFKKALKVYAKIGDIVSSSYTLWSLSKTYVMLGRYETAKKYLKEAEKFFRKTKDPRGMIYCLLSEAELKALAGRKKSARAVVSGALELARAQGFAVEACHAEAMLSVLEGAPSFACYDDLGLKQKYKELPFNLP